eukprot:CAMPEP_0115193520 /NCGR_PEP_ID=MMETSP0270-20121206/13597_1 /TAXON_ID=71861 /ORGANISM="Scrippsiella trochoidea, Strain CCMP3099" /LENGTH=54 /DNA_ID=CAMNT_0002606793 /DNA_START=11 /DNA_END=175 /DNA_ORIENTATION=-
MEALEPGAEESATSCALGCDDTSGTASMQPWPITAPGAVSILAGLTAASGVAGI